eukprot:4133007-Prymnesium_polylepis.2
MAKGELTLRFIGPGSEIFRAAGFAKMESFRFSPCCSLLMRLTTPSTPKHELSPRNSLFWYEPCDAAAMLEEQM